MSAESPPVRARRELKLILGSLALLLALVACSLSGVALAVYSYLQPIVPHRPEPVAGAGLSAPRGGWPGVLVRAGELALDPQKDYPAFALGAAPAKDRLEFTWSPGRRKVGNTSYAGLPGVVVAPNGEDYAVVDFVGPQATLVLRVVLADGTTHAIPLDDRYDQSAWLPNLAWSPKSERLAVSLRDGTVRVVDARSGRAKDVARTLAAGVGPPRVVAWLWPGVLIAAEHSATEVLLLNVDAGEVTQRVALPVASSSQDLQAHPVGRFLIATYEARDDRIGGSHRGAYVLDLVLEAASGVQGSGYDSWDTPLQVAWSPDASHFVGYAIDRPTVVTATALAQKGRNVGRIKFYRRDGALVRQWELAPLFADVPMLFLTQLDGLCWGADGYVYLAGLGRLARLDPTQDAPPQPRPLGTSPNHALGITRLR